MNNLLVSLSTQKKTRIYVYSFFSFILNKKPWRRTIVRRETTLKQEVLYTNWGSGHWHPPPGG